MVFEHPLAQAVVGGSRAVCRGSRGRSHRASPSGEIWTLAPLVCRNHRTRSRGALPRRPVALRHQMLHPVRDPRVILTGSSGSIEQFEAWVETSRGNRQPSAWVLTSSGSIGSIIDGRLRFSLGDPHQPYRSLILSERQR